MSDIVACPTCGQKNRLKASAVGAPRCGSCRKELPWLVDASQSTFLSETRAELPVLVDFWAPWCPPCKMIAPMLERVSQKLAGRLKVVKVNVDENQALAAQFNARSIPLLVLLKDGREVERMVGALPLEQLLTRLNPYLPPSPQPTQA